MPNSIYCYDCKKLKETLKCGYCRDCQRKRNIAYRSNKDKVVRPRTGLCRCGEPMASYSKCYCSKCATQWKRDYREKNPETMKQIDKRISDRLKVDPIEKLKRKSRRLTRAAVANGFLDKDVCVRCGSDQDIKAHHEDYKKPFNIMWLCIKHHEERHAELDLLNVDLNDIDEKDIKKASFELKMKNLRREQQHSYIVDFLGCNMACDICNELGDEEDVLPYDDNKPYVMADYNKYDAESFGITWRCCKHKPRFAVDLEARLLKITQEI